MVKQVIVIRKDLKMRRGKEIAQAAHASIAFLTNRIRPAYNFSSVYLTDSEVEWINGIFTKICVYVNSEQELIDIYTKAVEANLTAHLIEDNGLTEFNGVKTKTCLCIGPNNAENIDTVTGHLTLY